MAWKKGNMPLRTAVALSSVAALVAIGLTPTGRAQQSTSVLVVDSETNRPVTTSTAELRAPGPRTAPVLLSGRADEQGRITLGEDISGIVSVSAPGYAVSRFRWPTRSTTINLSRAASLEVVIRATETGSLVDASVSVVLNASGNPDHRSMRAESGVARFDELHTAPGHLVVRADGYAPVVTPFSRLEPRLRVVQVYVERSASVAGRVTDGAGNPVAGAVLSVMYSPIRPAARQLASMLGGRLTTGSDGTFWIGGLVPDLELAILASDGRQSARPLRQLLSPGQRLEVVLELE